jgi:hypothetical protein
LYPISSHMGLTAQEELPGEKEKRILLKKFETFK